MRKGIVLAGGVGAGAALMYLLDPDRGRRRRARLHDQALHAAGAARATLGKRARDLSNRTRGLVAEAGTHFRCEQASDEVLAERVRSKMGRAVSEPGDIEVSVGEGRVTLRGVVFAHESERLLRCVARVRGVQGVENQLKIKRRHGEALKAERENGRGSVGRAPESLSAPRRFLATVAGSGLALYGAKRRGAFGSIVSVVGVSMLRRGLLDSEPHLRGGARDNGRAAV
jgi:hypothetical protein